MSSMEQIAPIVATLNIEQKLSLIEDLVSSIRKEGGIAPKASKAKGKKKADGDAEKKPKKKAALGTLAWTAYVKHMKETRPEAFTGLTKESDKLVIIKGIRAENAQEYVTWTDAWKAEHKDDSSSVSDAASDSASVAESASDDVPVAPTPAKKASAKEVAQAKAAEKASAKAAKEAEKEAEKTAKAAAKEAEKTAKAAAKAEKPAKKPVKTAKKAEEETPKKEIDGVSYWHHPENNGLWEVIDGQSFADGCGDWIGYFQPGNDDEPIRFTKAFGSDEEL